ncbi:unnamed protein product, partial [Mesorhabditis spiculigera]
MRRTAVCLVRGGQGGGFLSRILGKKPDPPADHTMSEQQKEALAKTLGKLRTDVARPRDDSAQTASFSDDLIDSRIDIDAIRARGVMKYRYNYTPPHDIEERVLKFAGSILGTRTLDRKLEDSQEKFKLISAIGSELNHFPTNSRLHQIKTVADLAAFYEEPVKNVDDYTKMARSTKLPPNVSMAEQPARFNPEDKDAWHGGVTAYPGAGGKVYGLRNQRILRQYQPKSEWYDYEDTDYDYTRVDKDMPWDKEVAEKMDRYPDRRYSLSRKAFQRTA